MNTLSPMAQVRQLQAYTAISSLPPGIREQLADAVLKSQKSVQPWPYYSTIRVLLTRSGASPNFLYTQTSVTTRKCFNYGIGQAMDVAGFTAGTAATSAQTNVLNASTTRDNADVMIWGVACELGETSDPIVAANVWNNSALFMSLSGTDVYQVGRLAQIPGAGGLYGSASSLVATPPLDSTHDVPAGFLSNGNPMAGNFMRLPQAFWWNAQGSGKKDTSLVMSLETQPISIGPLATVAVATGVAGYAPPTSVFADIIVRLVSVSLSERSVNS